MHRNNSRLLYLAAVTSCVMLFAVVVSSQTRTASNLRRDQAVIRRDRPTVYLCLDRKTDNDVWLKIYDNTIWTIRFAGGGKSSRLIDLPDGTRVGAFSNGAVASPEYRFESRQTGAEVDYSWGDVHTFAFLPSDNYVLFRVPASKFERNLLFLEYQYEWEFSGAVGSESNPPQHRVYFSGNSCTW